MTLPDKLSEASAQQLATQIDFFQALTTRAFANAERILALNIQTTRAALEHSSGAARQLAGASDPRDIFALSNQSQQQMEALLEYGRKLMEITQQPAPAAAPAPAAPAPQAPVATAPPVMVDEPVAEAAFAPEPEPEPEPDPERPASAILPRKHPLGEADHTPAPVMAAKPKPIARAAGKVAKAPADTPHPAAMPMPAPGPVAIPAIAPVDASAAPAPPEAEATPAPKPPKGSKKR